MKFHEDRCKGEAVMRMKPNHASTDRRMDGWTDRRTDGQGDSSIPPPKLVAGGIMSMESTRLYQVLPAYCYSILM